MATKLYVDGTTGELVVEKENGHEIRYSDRADLARIKRGEYLQIIQAYTGNVIVSDTIYSDLTDSGGTPYASYAALKAALDSYFNTASGGSEAERVSFVTAIKADKKYYTTDSLRHTQTGNISFTVDNTGAVIDGGHIVEIVGSGDNVTFTTDFGAINSNLALTYNSVTLASGTIYKFVFYWTGSKMNVMIGALDDVANPPVQLNAPTLSGASWDSSTQVSLTLTDANTSPNEVETEVEYSIKDANDWLLGDTVAQDGTSVVITGLNDVNGYDFRAKAIGDGSATSDSAYSSTVTIEAVTPSIILMSDNFNDNSIDSGKWSTTSPTNAVVAETGSQLSLSSTGAVSGRFGLSSANGYTSSNDLIIVQAKVTIPNDADGNVFFGLTTSPVDETEMAVLIKDVSNPTQYSILVKDANVNEINEATGIVSGKDVRVKYVPSTGAVSFEYWNTSSWTSLGSSGNIDLGTTVRALLFINASGVYSAVTIDDFYISEDDYSTQYPT